MNKLIIYPLLFLVFLCLLSQVYLIDVNGSGSLDLSYNGSLIDNGKTGNITENGEQKELGTQGTEAVFDVNMTTGLIALIIGLVIVGVVAGIRVLDSGLSEYSVKLIYNATVYYGLWGMFSILSYGILAVIPLIGVIAWFILTLIYSLGFFETMT